MDFPGGSAVKNPPAKAGDVGNPGLIPGSGRSPAEENGNPHQYSCLDNPMGRGAWWATVHEVTKSETWLKKLSMQMMKLINCGKFWKRWEYQTTWPASWETYMQVRKQHLEPDMEQQTGSK